MLCKARAFRKAISLEFRTDTPSQWVTVGKGRCYAVPRIEDRVRLVPLVDLAIAAGGVVGGTAATLFDKANSVSPKQTHHLTSFHTALYLGFQERRNEGVSENSSLPKSPAWSVDRQVTTRRGPKAFGKGTS